MQQPIYQLLLSRIVTLPLLLLPQVTVVAESLGRDDTTIVSRLPSAAKSKGTLVLSTIPEEPEPIEPSTKPSLPSYVDPTAEVDVESIIQQLEIIDLANPLANYPCDEYAYWDDPHSPETDDLADLDAAPPFPSVHFRSLQSLQACLRLLLKPFLALQKPNCTVICVLLLLWMMIS
jgi:hypothetical protein